MTGFDPLWVGLAGALGAAARFVVDGEIRHRRWSSRPVGTLVINLTGSLALGILTGLVIFHGAPSALTLVAGTGFCGGYTTFSTASFETVRLVQSRDYRGAAFHLGLSVFGSVILAAAGLGLARL